MKSQTSLVAQQTRLQHWAEQIKSCQSRPIGTSVDDWCLENNITRANYYYRLKRVREACLIHVQKQEGNFVELPVPSSAKQEMAQSRERSKADSLVAILRGPNNLSVEIYSTATPEFIQSLIGTFAYVK